MKVREKIQEVAKELARDSGWVFPADMEFETSQNTRARQFWSLAKATYSMFFGKDPDLDAEFEVVPAQAPPKKKTKPLKMFVWEKVLSDHTDGMMVALAVDVRQARRLLRDKGNDAEDVVADLRQDPQVVKSPKAFLVHGGG